jgi:hypothetical protein
VKTLRIWLVLLLVVLLPVRGAVAAGMLCEVESRIGDSATTSVTHDHAQIHEHLGHHGDGGHQHVSHADKADGDKVASADAASDQTTNVTSGADACSLCAGCCSAAGIVGNLPVLAPPHALNPVPFPSFAAAAPSFISGGLERPPRII